MIFNDIFSRRIVPIELELSYNFINKHKMRLSKIKIYKLKYVSNFNIKKLILSMKNFQKKFIKFNLFYIIK